MEAPPSGPIRVGEMPVGQRGEVTGAAAFTHGEGELGGKGGGGRHTEEGGGRGSRERKRWTRGREREGGEGERDEREGGEGREKCGQRGQGRPAQAFGGR